MCSFAGVEEKPISPIEEGRRGGEGCLLQTFKERPRPVPSNGGDDMSMKPPVSGLAINGIDGGVITSTGAGAGSLWVLLLVLDVLLLPLMLLGGLLLLLLLVLVLQLPVKKLQLLLLLRLVGGMYAMVAASEGPKDGPTVDPTQD